MITDESAQTRCVQLATDKLLIAVPDGRCWLTGLGSSTLTPLPVSPIAAERASLAASIVEGAISAGLSGSADATTVGPYTLPRYIRWLAGNYVFAGQTPGLFRRAGERFDALGRSDLAAFARQKAEEEEGHAQLAYRDLESFGLPAAQAIRLIAPPSANLFAERFRTYVESGTPIALFGFSYCLERMAVGRDDAFVRAVEAICPANAKVYRFLKVHSMIGSDRAHVDEQLSVFESFSAAELETIARAAYETAELLTRQPLIDQAFSDEEIEHRLRGAGIDAPFLRTGAGAGEAQVVI